MSTSQPSKASSLKSGISSVSVNDEKFVVPLSEDPIVKVESVGHVESDVDGDVEGDIEGNDASNDDMELDNEEAIAKFAQGTRKRKSFFVSMLNNVRKSSASKKFREQRMRLRSAFKELFQNWSEKTTIHGIGFITAKSHPRYRRAAWCIFEMVCLALLINQITDRVRYYYSLPVTVNVEINKRTSLEFPTVTICNQNAFRLTRAAEEDLYSNLTKVYRTKLSRHNIMRSLPLPVQQLSTKEMFNKTAYDIETLLIKCSWYGHDCSASNFTRIFTDHGVCFAFNYEGEPLSVNDTGSLNGLSLLLNIQQYEYMSGPFESAGIRFHMHTRDSFPMVTDLGQAAGVGTHAFVGLKVVQSSGLLPPYGKCSDRKIGGEPYNEKKCVLECRFKYFVEKCRCREFYMPDMLNLRPDVAWTPVCTLRQLMLCVKEWEGGFIDYQRSANCNCPMSCKDTFYEPNLSFSTVSNLGLSNLGHDGKLVAHIKKDFIYARDVSALVRKSSRHADEVELRAFIQSYGTLYDTMFVKLPHFLDEIENFTSNEMQYHLQSHKVKVRFLEEQVKVVQANWVRGFESADERTLAFVAHQFYEYEYQFKEHLDMLVRMCHESQKDVFEAESPFSPRRMLMFEILLALHTRRLCSEAAHSKVVELYYCYANATPYFTHKIQHELTIDEVKVLAPKRLLQSAVADQQSMFFESHSLQLNGTYSALAELVEEVNRNGHYDAAHYKQLKQNFLEQSKAWLNYRANFLKTSFTKPMISLYDRLSQFRKDSDTITIFHETLLKDFQKLRNQTVYVLRQTHHILPILENIKTYLNTSKNRVSRENYLKSDLANDFVKNSDELFFFCDVLGKLGETLRFFALSWPNGWSHLHRRVTHLWSEILTDSDAFDQYRLRNFTHWLHKNFTEFKTNLTTVYESLQENMTILRDAGGQDGSLTDDIYKLIEKMKEYQKGNNITAQFLRENFVRLDIFFRELNIEDVIQQQAYTTTALLSDLGGTMGLCIGASLLSLFELLDLLVMTTYEANAHVVRKVRNSTPSESQITPPDESRRGSLSLTASHQGSLNDSAHGRDDEDFDQRDSIDK